MKKLFVIRHAKSSWDLPELDDIERPLLPKGMKRTQRIVDYLNIRKIEFDVFISSPAVRAYETAKIIAEGTGYNTNKIHIDKNIYFGNSESYFNAIYELDEHIDKVVIFGHNPTITQFANYFLNDKIDYLPTSGVVGVEFLTNNWNSIPNCKWSPIEKVYPKMLKK